MERVVQERPGVFFVHFRAPEPMCCIAGRRHSSPGNENPYLIFKRDEPRLACYQCFANSCKWAPLKVAFDVKFSIEWFSRLLQVYKCRQFWTPY
jgi:hypothetical protein